MSEGELDSVAYAGDRPVEWASGPPGVRFAASTAASRWTWVRLRWDALCSGCREVVVAPGPCPGPLVRGEHRVATWRLRAFLRRAPSSFAWGMDDVLPHDRAAVSVLGDLADLLGFVGLGMGFGDAESARGALRVAAHHARAAGWWPAVLSVPPDSWRLPPTWAWFAQRAGEEVEA